MKPKLSCVQPCREYKSRITTAHGNPAISMRPVVFCASSNAGSAGINTEVIYGLVAEAITTGIGTSYVLPRL